jgi:hypothetical protein
MSLKPFSAYVVPGRTASVARAAFSASSLCIRRKIACGASSVIKVK